MLKIILAALAIGIAASTYSVAALGSTPIVDAAGFEQPAFVPGILEGQSVLLPPQARWQFAGDAGTLAMVQSTVAEAGSQALQVDRVPGADGRWLVLSDQPIEAEIVRVTWDMRVEQSSAAFGSFGPFFGVELFDDRTQGLPIGLAGSLGVDSATGDVLYQATGTGAFVETGAVAVFEEWNRLELIADYSRKLYEGYWNDELIVIEPFVDDWTDEFTDADISAFAAANDQGSQLASATAYFDNFLVTSTTAIVGDYNRDGIVNVEDRTRWALQYGADVTADQGADGNGDGIVDASDYTVWRDALVPATVSDSDAVTVVPEPASLLLAMLAVVLVESRFKDCKRNYCH